MDTETSDIEPAAPELGRPGPAAPRPAAPEPAAPEPAAPEPRAAAREARAERYFRQDLGGQRRWYGDRATLYKGRAQVLGLCVVAAGAATTFFQVFRAEPWVPVATALLGALIALAEGWRQIARYDETWAAYRNASERMKRERRLYVNGAGEYRALADEQDAFLHFVESIEAIVAEEQRIYWQGRGDGATRPRPGLGAGVGVGIGAGGTGSTAGGPSGATAATGSAATGSAASGTARTGTVGTAGTGTAGSGVATAGTGLATSGGPAASRSLTATSAAARDALTGLDESALPSPGARVRP